MVAAEPPAGRVDLVAVDPAAGRVDLHVVPYAGIATRAVGLAVDVVLAQAVPLIVFGIIAVIGTIFPHDHFSTLAKVLVSVGWIVFVVGYFVLFWSSIGQTPGMKLMQIRVVNAEARPPGTWRSLVRFGALLLCILPLCLPFVTVLFDNRRRGPHDMLANTTVVYAEEE
jgi:uncharacterized RDD family membrane protein YckC